jgi:hypothetical protein
MDKSENVSKFPTTSTRPSGSSPKTGSLPFDGLGFDLGLVLSRRVTVVVLGSEARRPEALPADTPLPSGRELQLSLGREIRGR